MAYPSDQRVVYRCCIECNVYWRSKPGYPDKLVTCEEYFGSRGAHMIGSHEYYCLGGRRPTSAVKEKSA